jgi:FkbM family methyltransferase
MLIPLDDLISEFNLSITGIIHIGAHLCEERSAYLAAGIPDSSVLWFEALPNMVDYVQSHCPSVHIFQAVLSNKDDEELVFRITNSTQSSSLLELETHKEQHPHIHEIGQMNVRTVTMDTIFKRHHFSANEYNFVNIDVQGAELKVLQGMMDILPFVDYLYLEVNEEHLYKDCALIGELDAFLSAFRFKRVKTVMTEHKWGDAFYQK